MDKKETYCISCKKKIWDLSDVVIFKCPNCLKEDIVRCRECRVKAIKYICDCGFEGPN
ncbi:MAG: zinc finger domain-containing protein [Candidatus Woesearchaeota archaeon]